MAVGRRATNKKGSPLARARGANRQTPLMSVAPVVASARQGPLCQLTTGGHHVARLAETTSCSLLDKIVHMATALFDVSGIRVGKLLIKFRHVSGEWECDCDCGRRSILMPNTPGLIPTNCGCVKRVAVITHGQHGTAEYKSWRAMIDRCTNEKSPGYPFYGGRGITVAKEWVQSFEAFIRDVGPRPSRAFSLDRIENNGNYERGNVRWATRKEQENNKRSNRLLTHDGKTMTLAQWSDHIGLNYNSLRTRLRKGWPLERVLATALESR